MDYTLFCLASSQIRESKELEVKIKNTSNGIKAFLRRQGPTTDKFICCKTALNRLLLYKKKMINLYR